jgi:hypothetical protein
MPKYTKAVVVADSPTSSPSLSTVGIRRVIASIAVWGGLEFILAPSYQQKALYFLENELSPVSKEEYVVYYVLACIYYASSGVRNSRTDSLIPDVDPISLAGWIKSDNWVTDSDKCTWYGITCNDANTVIEIDLHQNQMLGLFAPEIQLLGNTLEVLDVTGNLFLSTDYDNGNSWMAKMTNLKKFYVAETSFGYDGIPVYLNGMISLEELDISNTFFNDGPIRADAFEGLTNLRYLDMSCNDYTSTIPSSITNLPNLEFFYFENVVFSGSGVTQSLNFLVGMPTITECWVDKTSLEGGIPSELGTVTSLASFSASECSLHGSIPSELGNLQAMSRIWLHGNALTGRIPTNLGQLEQLKFIQVEGNRLDGDIPDAMCSLTSLQSIGADCNAENGNFVACPCCTCCGVSKCQTGGPVATAKTVTEVNKTPEVVHSWRSN